MNSDYVERIYEAAAAPDRWPSLLHEISTKVGAKGGVIFVADTATSISICSPDIEEFCADYISGGWFQPNVRAEPMLADLPEAFITDTTYLSAEQMRDIPLYRDFLIPARMDAAAGTLFPGTKDDLIALVFEGFGSHHEARAALPHLDAVRRHLGRAMGLTSRLQIGRARTMVASLDMAGTPAAVLDSLGRCLASNEQFSAQMSDQILERRGRLAFSDPRLQAAFGDVVSRKSKEGGSIVVPGTPDQSAAVMHLLPLRRSARDIFNADGWLLVLASPSNTSLPTVDVLRLLFDLTYSEARIARRIVEGLELKEAAKREGVAYSTARTHLRSIFAKTRTNRQTELALLLSGFAAPVSRDFGIGGVGAKLPRVITSGLAVLASNEMLFSGVQSFV